MRSTYAIDYDYIITMPNKNDKSDWNEEEITADTSFGDRYYRVTVEEYNDKLVMINGYNAQVSSYHTDYIKIDTTLYIAVKNNRLILDSFDMSLEFPVEFKEVNVNDVNYYEYYLPQKLDYTLETSKGNVNVSYDLTDNSNPNSSIEFGRSTKILNQPTKVITYLEEVFKMPDKTNKNNWVEKDVTVGQSFGGNYYRFKLPETVSSVNLFNVTIKNGKSPTTQSLVYNPNNEKIVFVCYSVEYVTVVYDNVVYLEFYLPEFFDLKACYSHQTDTTFHHYYDETYKIKLVTNEDIRVIEEPLIKPEEPGEEKSSEETEEKTGCGSFFEDVGVIVNELFKIQDTDPVATGSATLIIGGLVVVIILIGLIRR